VELNRPEKRNAMNKAFWSEMVTCFNKISTDSSCRAVVLSGSGKIFTAGIDLQSLAGEILQGGDDLDVGRKAFFIGKMVPAFQESFTVLEKCTKPVFAAIHGACVGGGIDMISACDIRYCTQDAWFQVKEVDIGIIADVGTLQRFPKIVGNDSLVRELCYTARQLKADEALSVGLVSRVLPDKETMLAAAMETAKLIASKSPVAVQGTKISLVYSRDHSVPDGLAQVATMNQAFLQSEDVIKAATAAMTKQPVTFSKL
jgi:delta(3,5)-delta(2,4)-dienoyl-CoA isomerase